MIISLAVGLAALAIVCCALYYLQYRVRFKESPPVEQSVFLWLTCLASFLVLVPCLALMIFSHQFWMGGGEQNTFFGGRREGSQIHTRKLPTGDVLVNTTRFTYGWQDGMYKSSTLAIRWKDTGETEPITNTSQLIPNIQHFAIETDENHIVIAAGGKVFSRKKTGNKGDWNVWKLNASPQIFAFIKEHLEKHFPNSYTNGISKGESFIEVSGDFSQNEYSMRIYATGSAGLEINSGGAPIFPYEVESIDLEAGQLIAVTSAKNHLLPKLVFSKGISFDSWNFDLNKSSMAQNQKASKN